MIKYIKSFSVNIQNVAGITPSTNLAAMLPDTIVNLDRAVNLKGISGGAYHLLSVNGLRSMDVISSFGISNPDTGAPVISDNGVILSLSGSGVKSYYNAFYSKAHGVFDYRFEKGVYLPVSFSIFQFRVANSYSAIVAADTIGGDLTFYYEDL